MRNVYGWSLVAMSCLCAVGFAQQVREGNRNAPGNAPAAGEKGTRADAPGGDAIRGNEGGTQTGRAGTEAGQPGRTGRNPNAAVQPGTTGGTEAHAGMSHGTADQQIAACLYRGNRNQVEIAKFVMPKLASEDAKEFAAMMVKEHQPIAEKLMRAAGPLASASMVAPHTGTIAIRENANPARTAEAAGTRRTEGGATGANAAAHATSMHGMLNWNQVGKELADQCLASAKDELGRYQGADLDKAYIGCQIAAHMHMKDELTVFQKHVSSEMRPDLEKALQSTEEHLKLAREIMEKRKDQGSKGSDGRSETRSTKAGSTKAE